MAGKEKVQKDVWDRLEAMSKIFAAIALPVVLAVGGYFLNQRMELQKQREARSHLYMTLMNQREGADSALRKDMFQHIIKSVVGQKDDDIKLRDQILNLELLAYNFHDSIDLRALFYSIQSDLKEKSKRGKIAKGESSSLQVRLKRLGAEVRNRQFAAIKELQNTAYFTVNLADVGVNYSKPPVTCRIPNKNTGHNDEVHYS